ncbi:hypothetical protein PV721_26640 [Streptomyces sp. MB09-01]|uniref:hypothetical protein n=1 Tax=Streptomyces sp. MB09-01 TaxID=3028666 RepID=UPI0029B06D31|nr:hypothetical protein [Streptomyces sp. MB09-01]MDX3537871.1 hypothetical protein [Streptomyces sp. MB09-01]
MCDSSPRTEPLPDLLKADIDHSGIHFTEELHGELLAAVTAPVTECPRLGQVAFVTDSTATSGSTGLTSTNEERHHGVPSQAVVVVRAAIRPKAGMPSSTTVVWRLNSVLLGPADVQYEETAEDDGRELGGEIHQRSVASGTRLDAQGGELAHELSAADRLSTGRAREEPRVIVTASEGPGSWNAVHVLPPPARPMPLRRPVRAYCPRTPNTRRPPPR